MASQLNITQIKLGTNVDTSKNFIVSVPTVADGTLTIARENGTTVASIDSNGVVSTPKNVVAFHAASTTPTIITSMTAAAGFDTTAPSITQVSQYGFMGYNEQKQCLIVRHYFTSTEPPTTFI